ncbi:primase-helicase family protein [Roseomonas sp. WA12]
MTITASDQATASPAVEAQTEPQADAQEVPEGAKAEAGETAEAEAPETEKATGTPAKAIPSAVKPKRREERLNNHFWDDSDQAHKFSWTWDYVVKKLGTGNGEKGLQNLEHITRMLMQTTDRYALANIGGRPRVIDLMAEKFVATPLDTHFKMYGNFAFPIHNQDGIPTRAELTLAELWFKFPKRLNYTEGVTFAPPTEDHTPFVPPVTYNLFQGFDLPQPSYPGYPRFREHLFDNVCQGDEDRFNFVMMWFADILRNPGHKPGSAMVFRGLEGVGKSMVGVEFAKIVGPRYRMEASSEHHVLGNFNAHLSTALFLQCEEALFAGSKSGGVLKNMVTSETLPIEMKGIDTINMPNFTRILMCSNETWVVPASADARRWFVTDVCPDHKGDRAYFQAIIDEMNNGGRAAWVQELMTWPIDIGLLRNPPDTWELQEQRLHSFDLVQTFFIDLLREGNRDIFPQGEGAEAEWVMASEFDEKVYHRFESYILDRKANYSANRTKFRRGLRDTLFLEPKQKKIDGVNERRYKILPLDALRVMVADRLKIDLEELL